MVLSGKRLGDEVCWLCCGVGGDPGRAWHPLSARVEVCRSQSLCLYGCHSANVSIYKVFKTRWILNVCLSRSIQYLIFSWLYMSGCAAEE